MIVQEAGMAVGWPLGLGHDTTGWPLGLRLRLTQEDLQWPREPPLDDFSTYSTNSSSLDTESTRSFFQDKSISLGKLIGLPTNHYSHARNNNSQPQRRNSLNTSSLRVFPTSSSSGSRCNSDHHHHHWRSGSKPRSSGHCSSHGSNPPPSKGAMSAVWALLSVANCAKIHSAHEAGSKSSKSSSPSKTASRRGSSELSTSNAPEIQARTNSSIVASIPFMGRSPAPASKLYDNITFEEESTEHDDPHSSEWNPLFASSPLADDDEHDENPDAATEPLEHLRQSLMRNNSSYSQSSQATEWSSASESFDKRKSSSPEDHYQPFSQFDKHSAMHLLLSRMVCCRSTPTVDS